MSWCLPKGTWALGTRLKIVDIYHLARKSVLFLFKSNGNVIFWKFLSEIMECLQRNPLFFRSEQNGGNFLHFAKLSRSQSLIRRNNYGESNCKWFADFGKTLTIIQRSSQPLYSDKWQAPSNHSLESAGA